MSVCRRKKGGFLVKYKENGKWRQRQFPTLELAEEFDSSVRADSGGGETLTLKEAVLVYMRNRELSEKSVYGMKFLLGGYASQIADRYVYSLNRRDLESLRQGILAAGNCPSSVNRYVGMLRAAMNWCVAEDLLRENPWAKYRNLRDGRRRHRNGTLEQLTVVYGELPDYARWAVRTILALCLRPGRSELDPLEWSVFNWRENTATVFMSKTRSYKTVFVPEWYIAEARERFRNGQKYVLVRSNGERLIYCTLLYHWRKACKKTGVSIPLYAIRHIAASEMLSNGTDIASVAAQLGHRNLATTAQFYTHALAKGQRLAAASVPDIGENSPKPQLNSGESSEGVKQ